MVLMGLGRTTPEGLLNEADLAMYVIKRGKRGGDVGAHRQLPAPDHDDLEEALTDAIERGEVSLAYQPIVSAGDGRVVGLEALVRWTHPRRGPIAPTTLIPLAERSGQITVLGGWVLEQALAAQRRWQADRGEPLGVSVNVSAHQLTSTGFAATVRAALKTTGVDPGSLTLELTETAFADDAEQVLVVLHALKALGVRLAIDDFGTGYSALTYLMRYPVDDIKIDREFIADLGPGRGAGTIVGALIQLAHGLDMTVVCEGVETAEQHDLVRDLGCDRCQGFLFARPGADEGLRSLIQAEPDGRNPTLPSHR
jgi:EAL domain-containing protein (putative c-di-GMP-specific phosphodiesterase class I)